MGDHAKRGHSILSASGAHRWLACPPSALLEMQFPDTTSESAAEGTLAHEVAEAKVRNYFLIDDFNKRKLNAFIKKQKENPLLIIFFCVWICRDPNFRFFLFR